MGSEKWFLDEFFLICLLFIGFCTCTDTITPTNSITGGEILLSSEQKFALGFFTPGNSSHLYLGIWFYKIPEQAIVWVANRDSPIEKKNSSSVVLTIDSHGNLVIFDGNTNTTVWSSNVSNTTARNNNSIGKLLDTGNLVLTHKGSEEVVWQSFDYPTDTVLPGMKIGLFLKRGLNRSVTSWKSRDDPGRGNYAVVLEPRGSPQLFLYKGLELERLWRGGPWNGLRISSVPEVTPQSIFKDTFVNTPDEISIMYNVLNSSIICRFVVDEFGSIPKQIWIEEARRWNIIWADPRERCDKYATCGANSICNYNYPMQCSCLPGFEPKSPRDWNLGYGSEGCVRKRLGQCGNGDGFLTFLHLKVPDTSVSRVDMSLSLEECKQECLRNCSCTAYTAADISGGGSGCLAWFGDLIDMREYESGGQDLYIRADAVDLAATARRDSKGFRGKKVMLTILFVSLFLGLLLFVAWGYCLLKKRRKRKEKETRRELFTLNLPSNSSRPKDSPNAGEIEETKTNPEVPFFDFNEIIAATENFSAINKLGQGGFGPVYKGQLLNGKKIAVKRLSKSSMQGIEEFKNEIMLLTKLQHRNLVKMLGCCFDKEEKMLIYEYLPNKSLDSFIFDKTRRALLDWSNRIRILVGIARGVIYLHQDSRLRIIHRDLKASNVLLDADMNPKISDFGIARIFGGDETEENTGRVVGTYGYMSPEYALNGQFSVKSDVFSFGVLLLEIVSGKKNSGYYHDDNSMNLIAQVWNLWKVGTALDIVDSSLGDSYPRHEVLRCIHIGLLCVEESASDRPTMSTVVFMLGNETNLPLPKQPAFVLNKTHSDPNSSVSINEMTVTSIKAR